MEKTIQLLTSLWGLGPWRTAQQKMEKDWIDLVYKEPCEIKMAFTKLGPIVLELSSRLPASPNGPGLSRKRDRA